jgi:predicted lactoylglutathione lyase
VIDSGVCYQAFFQDPDGNALAIHHRYAPTDVGPGT